MKSKPNGSSDSTGYEALGTDCMWMGDMYRKTVF